MKAQKILLATLMLLLAASSAMAHGGRGRVGVGVYFGPVWNPWFYPPPFYSQPPMVVLPPSPPPVYIEQYEAPAEAAQQYWYYCRGGKAYYPYVKECPEGWQKVLPQPEK
jgi:hypothetical protein